MENGDNIEEQKEYSEEDRVKVLLEAETDMFSLNLSGKQLFDMKLIAEEFQNGKRPYISTLDLSQNQLMELNLSNVGTLLTLKAAKNCLRTVSLHLPSLQVLDLTNNSLEAIPKLYNMLKLDQLYLAKNLISKFDTAMIPPSVTVLDLSDNLISLDREKYKSFIRGFKKFVFLEHLVIDKNDFAIKFPNYIGKITLQCQRIKTINRNPVAKEGLTKAEEGGQEEISIFSDEPPKLENLCKCIEEARKFPPSCQTEINKLMKYTELLQSMSEDKRTEQDYSDSAVQKDFFEQINMLHSSQPNYRKDICIILARLCSVKGIGEGAMMQLVKFMKSSRTLNEEIQPIISAYIVKKLTVIDEVTDMPLIILKLLSKMAKEVNISESLSPLVEKFAKFVIHKKSMMNPIILRLSLSIIAGSIRESKKNVSVLLSKSLHGESETGSKKAAEQEKIFITALRGLFLKPNMQAADHNDMLLEEVEQYKYVLEIIEYCSKHNKEAASQFCSKFYSEFLSALEASFTDYESLQSENQEGAKTQQAILICEIFAAEINSFSGVLNTSSRGDIVAILNHPKNDTIRKILGLVVEARADPKVLAAICRFALGLFKTDAVLNNVTVLVFS